MERNKKSLFFFFSEIVYGNTAHIFWELAKLFTDSERVQLFIGLTNGRNGSCDGDSI